MSAPAGATSPPAATPPAIAASQWTTWRFERGTRYYRLHLEQDLWGEWCLTRVHGRRNSHLGRSVTACTGTFDEAVAALMTAAARRRRRGYCRVARI